MIWIAASHVPTMSDRVNNNNNTKRNMRVTHSTCKQAVPPAWDDGWPHPCPTDEMKGWSFFFILSKAEEAVWGGGRGACRDKEVKCCRWVKMADKDKQNHLAWSLLSMKLSTAVPSRQLQSMSVSQLTINVVVYWINQTVWGVGLFPDFFIKTWWEGITTAQK